MKNLHSQMEFFYDTVNWKTYWVEKVKNYITGNIIDVGSGLGSNIDYLVKIGNPKSMLCLEPDKKLFYKLKKKKFNIKNKINFKNKSIKDLKLKKKYDTIIYADVLEHITGDKSEIKKAEKLLGKKGRLIILCPAHNYLYTEFDKNVGHHRRYNKKMFIKIKPNKMFIEKLFYLDSFGFFLSLFNKLFLNRNPKNEEIKIWDRYFVPVSIFLDTILNYTFGKSIICIYRKEI